MTGDGLQKVPFGGARQSDAFVAEGAGADSAQILGVEQDGDIDDRSVADALDDLLVGTRIGAGILDHDDVARRGDLFHHRVAWNRQRGGRRVASVAAATHVEMGVAGVLIKDEYPVMPVAGVASQDVEGGLERILLGMRAFDPARQGEQGLGVAVSLTQEVDVHLLGHGLESIE